MLNMITTDTELTLSEVLSAPVVRSVIDDDGADRDALEPTHGEIARTGRPRASSSRRLRGFWPTTPIRRPSTDHKGQ